jgi:hypothetical protein
MLFKKKTTSWQREEQEILLGSKTTGDTTGSGASQSKTNVFGNNDWRGGHLICMCMHKISEKDTSGCPYKPCQCLFEWMGACWKVHGGKATQVTRQIRHAILITCHQPDRCIWTKSLPWARSYYDPPHSPTQDSRRCQHHACAKERKRCPLLKMFTYFSTCTARPVVIRPDTCDHQEI